MFPTYMNSQWGIQSAGLLCCRFSARVINRATLIWKNWSLIATEQEEDNNVNRYRSRIGWWQVIEPMSAWNFPWVVSKMPNFLIKTSFSPRTTYRESCPEQPPRFLTGPSETWIRVPGTLTVLTLTSANDYVDPNNTISMLSFSVDGGGRVDG